MQKFISIEPETITDNTFKLIGKDWMLITSGATDNCNTMTASWGGFGVMWFKPVVFVVVRPQRHTFSFLEKNDSFTLSFFDESKRDILQFCGTNSGKDVDKIQKTGLTKFASKNGAVFFEEARLLLECKKIYSDDFKKQNFIDKSPLEKYSDDDFHRLYIAEITDCLLEKVD